MRPIRLFVWTTLVLSLGLADGTTNDMLEDGILDLDQYGSSMAAALEGSAEELHPYSPALGDRAVFWQGFEHRWNYNHRWNRFGHLVDHQRDNDGQSAVVQHTAASGIGPDIAEHRSSFAGVQAAGLQFYELRDRMPLDLALGELYEQHRSLSVELSGPVSGAAQAHVFLNGWDIQHVGNSPDIPVEFSLQAGEASIDATKGSIEAGFDLTIQMGCTSFECRTQDLRSEYVLDTRWLVVTGPQEALSITTQAFERDTSWGPPRLRQGKPLPDTNARTITGSDHTDSAVLAWRGISLKLAATDAQGAPEDHHMLGWKSRVLPGHYDGSRYSFELALGYENWGRGMRYSKLPFSIFTYGEPGAGSMRADIALVQFDKATAVTLCNWQGQVNWMRPQKSDPQQAIASVAVRPGLATSSAPDSLICRR